MNQTSPQQQPEDPHSDPPKLIAVTLITGEIWQVGRPVPGSDMTKSLGVGADGIVREIEGSEGQQTLMIKGMFVNEDASVDVYAKPVTGSAFEKQRAAAIFCLYPLTIQRTMTAARIEVWEDMLEDAELSVLDPDPDPDDPDPDLDDPEPAPPAVAAPAALPPSNGEAAS
jgi:hypothetical protein